MVKVMCSHLFLEWSKSKNASANATQSSASFSPPSPAQAGSNQSILSAAAGSARPSLPATPRWSNQYQHHHHCHCHHHHHHHHVAPACPVIGCPAHRVCLSVCVSSNVPKPQLPDLIPQLPPTCCSSRKIQMMASPPTSLSNPLPNSNRLPTPSSSSSPFYANTTAGRMSPLEIIFDQEADDSVFLPSLPENCQMRRPIPRHAGGCNCSHYHTQNSHYSNRYSGNRFSTCNYESDGITNRRSASVSLPLDMEAIREVGISLRRMSESFASSRLSDSCKNANESGSFHTVTQQIMLYCNWICSIFFRPKRNHPLPVGRPLPNDQQLPKHMMINPIYGPTTAREMDELRQRLRINAPARQRSYSTHS